MDGNKLLKLSNDKRQYHGKRVEGQGNLPTKNWRERQLVKPNMSIFVPRRLMFLFPEC